MEKGKVYLCIIPSVVALKQKEMIVRQLKDVQTIGKGRARAAKLVQGNNAFIGLLELDAGSEVPIHKDIAEEYLYVLSGGGKITINGESFDIEKGASVYMPRYAEVSYKNGDNTSRFIQVFAGPEPATKYKSWPEITFTW